MQLRRIGVNLPDCTGLDSLGQRIQEKNGSKDPPLQILCGLDSLGRRIQEKNGSSRPSRDAKAAKDPPLQILCGVGSFGWFLG